MSNISLVDLYVPAALASLDEAAAAASSAGLDAIVWVVHNPGELPEAGEVESVAEAHDIAIHPASLALGPGYRFAILLPEWDAPDTHDAVASLAHGPSIQASLAEVSGLAIPVCPRQSPDGEVARDEPSLADEPPVGTVALVNPATQLGLDLDLEDTGVRGRRILGGTGPFGELDAVGRFATMIPGDARDIEVLIDALSRGLGAAVEIVDPATAAARPAQAEGGRSRGGDGGRGRGGEGEGDGRRRRRSRRRGGRRGGGRGGEGGGDS